MATTTTAPITASIPKGRLWTGRIISWLCILFLVFDASMKIILERHSVEASGKVGWPVQTLQPLGFVLLACTILYAIPRTAILGAVLLTAWLGGATAENLRTGFPLWFSVVFGILVWLGLWLRDDRLRSHLPVRK
jgi:TRAP-type mannitol/chloroaromatic compound transport system permease small subunit